MFAHSNAMDIDDDDGDLRAYGVRPWPMALWRETPDAMRRTAVVGGAVAIAVVLVLLIGLMVRSPSRLPSFPVLRSPSDHRTSEYVVLGNGLRALIVSDPTCDKAGAAMDVEAGALDDPPDTEGLAHFLEHMLFLGSTKYPKEGDFSRFIQQHAGSSNAFTDQTHTNYHFVVHTDWLAPALDRLAQFFTAPLLSPSGAMREMNAVDSEHKKNLQSDGWAMWQLYKHLADARHPFHQFSTGSLLTLNKGDIMDELLAFYTRYYTSASSMRLVVLGKEPLPKLRAWIKEYFSSIPRQRPVTRPPVAFPAWARTGVRVDVRPVADLRRVALLWEVPPLEARYRNMVPGYLTHVLGGKQEGGLYHVLKAREWAQAVAVEVQNVRDFSFVELQIELTANGVVHAEEVTGIAFQFLNLLRAQGVSCEVWRDQWALERLAFRFQEVPDALGFLSTTASAMQYMDPADVLGSPEQFTCDAALLTRTVEALTPHRALMFVVSADAGNPTETEPLYGTRYAVSPFPADTIDRWATAAPSPDMAVPGANAFIPTVFDLLHPPSSQNSIRRLRQTAGLTVWHQPSQYFSQPKLTQACQLHYPALRTDPSALMLLQLYAQTLMDELEGPLYEAGEAGLEGDVAATGGSLVFSVSGHTAPSGRLWTVLLMAAKRGIPTPQRFAVLKERMRLDIANEKFANLYTFAWRDLKPLLLERPAFTVDEKLAALDAVTPDRLSTFAATLSQQPCRMECFGFGNVDEAATLRMAADLAAILHGSPTEEVRTKSVALIPEGVEAAVRSPCPNPSDQNSVLLSTYQYPTGASLPDALRLELIQFIIDQDAYNQLRTQEQLGYVVFTTAAYGRGPTVNMTYFHFLIQSAEQPPAFLDERAEAFLAAEVAVLEVLNVADLEGHKGALWQQRWPRPVNLAEEFAALWREIAGFTFAFHRKAAELDALAGITVADLLATYETVLLDPTTRRKVALWVSGRDADDAAHEYPLKPKQVVDIGALQQLTAALEWLPP